MPVNFALNIGAGGTLKNNGRVNCQKPLGNAGVFQNAGYFNCYGLFENNGLFDNLAQQNMTVYDNALVLNKSVFINTGNLEFFSQAPNNVGLTNLQDFTNNGQLTVNTSCLITNISTFTNNGIIDTSSGLDCQFNNFATLVNNVNGVIELGGLFNNFISGVNTGVVNNYGSINNQSNMEINEFTFLNNYSSLINVLSINNFGNLTNLGSFKNNGNLNNLTNGVMSNSASATFSLLENGVFSNMASFSNAITAETVIRTGGVVNNSSQFVTDGVLTNNGTFINSSAGTLTNNGTLDNKSTLENEGTILSVDTFINSPEGNILNSALITISGEATNNGTFTVNVAGTVVNNGTLTNNMTWTNNGSVTNNLTFFNESDGVFTNNLTLTNSNDFQNSGLVDNMGTTINLSTFFNNGTFNSRLELTNDVTGTFSNGVGAILNIIDGNFTNLFVLINDGSISVGDSTFYTFIINYGTFTNNSTLTALTGNQCNFYNFNTLVNNVNGVMALGGQFNNMVGVVNNYGSMTIEYIMYIKEFTFLNNYSTLFNFFLINNYGTLTSAYLFANNGNLNNFTGGVISNSADFIIDQNSLFSNTGTFSNVASGNTLIKLNGTLSNNNQIITDGALTNNGTFLVDPPGTVLNGGNLTNNLTMTNNGSVTNSLTFYNMIAGIFTNNNLFTNSSNFENNGLVNNTNTGTTTNSASFLNVGTLNISKALTNQVSGTFINDVGATINIRGNVFTFLKNYNILNNYGEINLGDAASPSINTVIFNYGAFTNFETLITRNGNKGNFFNYNSIINNLNGTIEFGGWFYNVSGTGLLNNFGSITSTQYVEIQASSIFFNFNLFLNSFIFDNLGIINNSGDMYNYTNAGVMNNIFPGTITNTGTFNVADGSGSCGTAIYTGSEPAPNARGTACPP